MIEFSPEPGGLDGPDPLWGALRKAFADWRRRRSLRRLLREMPEHRLHDILSGYKPRVVRKP
jgi:hypothetical protein